MDQGGIRFETLSCWYLNDYWSLLCSGCSSVFITSWVWLGGMSTEKEEAGMAGDEKDSAAHVREMESTPSLGEKYFKYFNINWTEIQLTDDEEGQWERYIEDEYGVTQVTWGDRNWGETKWSVPIDGGWLSRLCQSDQKARDLRSRACKLLKTHAPNKVPSHKKDLRQLGI